MQAGVYGFLPETELWINAGVGVKPSVFTETGYVKNYSDKLYC